MIQYVICYVVALLLELLAVWWINRREAKLCLGIKKYGLILGLGNLFLLGLAWYKQSQSGIPGWWYFGLFTYLLCLTIYDLKFRELPDWWHLLLALFYAVAWALGKQPVELMDSGIMLLVYAAVFGLILLLRREMLGVGDMKLLLLCGIYAGSASVGVLIRGMIAAFFVSLVLLLLKKATTKSELPFVPFLLLGALLI